MSLLNSDSDDVRALGSGFLKCVPFILVECRSTVNKELLRRLAVLVGEGVEHFSNEVLRLLCLEMELEIAGLPWAIRTPEDNSVPFIEKLLSRATGVFTWV